MSTHPRGKLTRDAWVENRKHYHAGLLSVRELARQFRVSEGAIRKTAKRYGWQRDLLPRVRQELRRRMVQDAELARPFSEVEEQQVVREKAGEAYTVIQLHRSGCRHGREMYRRLLEERGALSAVMEQKASVTAGDDKKRLSAILKVTSLPVRAAILRDLSVVLSRIIRLERQAWNLGENESGETYEDKLKRLMTITG